MDDQNKNLILAMVLSSLVLVVWMILFAPEPTTAPEGAPEATAQTGTLPPAEATQAEGAAPETASAPTPETARVAIDTPNFAGSISLVGGRIDELTLRQYDVTLDSEEKVTLLSPVGSAQPYYAAFGWVPGGSLAQDAVPTPDTVWTLESGAALTPATPVTLRWDSPSGLIFRRTLAVDEKFMFDVTQSVENPTGAEVRLAPYGMVARHGMPDNLKKFFIIHEGAMRMSDGILGSYDYTYKEMQDLRADDRWGAQADVEEVTESGWVGFTDHYWMTTLIPARGGPFTSVIQYLAESDIYRTVARMPTLTVAPGATGQSQMQVFAGAKEYEAIRNYEAGERITGFGASFNYALFGEEKGVPGFLEAIEWGWFAFLTKPIFFALHEINKLIGNMGWAIIGLTLLIKALLFPLARKSYISMAKMKELQPEMEKLKERVGDDRQKMQVEMMALYKKEKVNPAAGCLPILMQIPIFFSLYKVIFVTLELRQASFFGPFQDLSLPDPTSIWNLFGLFPWDAPEPQSLLALVFIGILPLLLGISMWLQQKLNPAPTDPTQQMIFAWMPWIFMFMLGGFASGLVIYWIANNTITFIQQYVIMRSHGYKPDIWGNIRGTNKPAAVSANKDQAPGKKK